MYPLEESHRAVPDRRSSQVWSTARRWLAGDRTHSRRDRPQPTVETLEGRVLLSLTPVPRNAKFPFTTIVELRTTMPNGESYLGSGVMVDQFHVLTVGHI